jgi:hypothetical protein
MTSGTTRASHSGVITLPHDTHACSSRPTQFLPSFCPLSGDLHTPDHTHTHTYTHAHTHTLGVIFSLCSQQHRLAPSRRLVILPTSPSNHFPHTGHSSRVAVHSPARTLASTRPPPIAVNCPSPLPLLCTLYTVLYGRLTAPDCDIAQSTCGKLARIVS